VPPQLDVPNWNFKIWIPNRFGGSLAKSPNESYGQGRGMGEKSATRETGGKVCLVFLVCLVGLVGLVGRDRAD